jgi:hypothetical protein
MTHSSIGKPYGDFKIDREIARLLNSIDNSTIMSYKLLDSEDMYCGFSVAFDIHAEDLEDPEDLDLWMIHVPKEHRVRVIPVGTTYSYIRKYPIPNNDLSEAAHRPDVLRRATVLLGEDSSIWIDDKSSIYKVSDTVQDFILLPAELHWKRQYLLEFEAYQ